MEPMTLGSPVGSPNGPHGATSPFLPSFLMGDPNQPTSTPMSNKSPSRLAHHLSFSGHSMSGRSPQQQTSPQSQAFTPSSAGAGLRQDRVTGPPTRGLFDEPATPQYDNSLYTHPNTSVYSPDRSVDGGSDITCWVTVFGFPPSSASIILAQFACYGHVSETRSSPGCNWVHLRYTSRSEARRALSSNGKVFGDSVMIGVVPCRDQDIVGNSQQKENMMFPNLNSNTNTPRSTQVNSNILDSSSRSTGFNTTSPFSPGNYSMTSPVFGGQRDTPRNMVSQAYRQAQYDHDVVLQRNIPRKSTSMVTRAWEFLGW